MCGGMCSEVCVVGVVWYGMCGMCSVVCVVWVEACYALNAHGNVTPI